MGPIQATPINRNNFDFSSIATMQSPEAIHENHSRRSYSRGEGITWFALAGIVPFALGFVTETQLAAYELGQGAENKTNNVFSKLILFIKQWIPFTNEFAGVLSHSGVWPWIYLPNTAQQMFVDATALLGFAWNSLDEAKEYGNFSGFLKFAGLLGFSFMAPKTFIPFIQDIVQGIFQNRGFFSGSFGRLVSGTGAILILESCVRLWDAYIIPLFEDGAHWIKTKLSGAKDKDNSISSNQPTKKKDKKSRWNPIQLISNSFKGLTSVSS